MASSDNRIAVADLKPGMKFRYSGRKYRSLDVLIQCGVAYVYIATSIFPMEFYPNSEVELV